MQSTHKELFLKYRDDNVIVKATQYARWTLPQLMADLATVTKGQAVILERDFQEIGPLLVNNLSAKLARLLFPNGRPFFKISASAALRKRAEEGGVTPTELNSGMAKLELESCKQLFLNGSYEQLVMALKHLVVTGNVLLYRDTVKHRTVTYGVQSFAVRRDGQGNLLCCILREFTDFETLAPDVQAALTAKYSTRYQNPAAAERIELYTKVARGQDMEGKVTFTVSQEVEGIPVGTPGVYPEHLCPWQVPTWSLVAGENYGRGLVEDYAGGFARLSDESHASTLYSIAMAKVVNLVAPGSGADVDELQDAETGEYVSGNKDAVTALEMGDAQKYAQMQAAIAAVFDRLARAFMYRGNTRDAERVTAEEIKQDAQEVENSLGGVYSSLSASMQVPLAHVLLTELDESMLAGIIGKDMKLNIVAGIPALAAAAEVQNLAAAAQDAGAIIPVLVQLSKKIDPQKLLDVIFAGRSVDTSMIYKDEAQLQKEAQIAQQEAQAQAQIAQSDNLVEQQQALGAIQG